MTAFTQDYDPGFVNVPGFGQSATNPLAPVFYQSLGVVEDLTVYESLYAAQKVSAGEEFNLGPSRFTRDGFEVHPPGTFLQTVRFAQTATFDQPIVVQGIRFRPKVIRTISGNHTVLAAY
jgi:hypothetical protein